MLILVSVRLYIGKNFSLAPSALATILSHSLQFNLYLRLKNTNSSYSFELLLILRNLVVVMESQGIQ